MQIFLTDARTFMASTPFPSCPQRLKPPSTGVAGGTTEVVSSRYVSAKAATYKPRSRPRPTNRFRDRGLQTNSRPRPTNRFVTATYNPTPAARFRNRFGGCIPEGAGLKAPAIHSNLKPQRAQQAALPQNRSLSPTCTGRRCGRASDRRAKARLPRGLRPKFG